MYAELAIVAALALALLGALCWQQLAFRREREAERAAFAEERREWARERRDLNNRIQIPEAAPFMDEEEGPEDRRDDRPTLPEFTMDEAELERARRELANAGYEEGPVG